MRRYITETGNTTIGYKDKTTAKPTYSMMTTMFLSIIALKIEHQRQLARPLNMVQLEYLKALNVEPSSFSSP